MARVARRGRTTTEDAPTASRYRENDEDEFEEDEDDRPRRSRARDDDDEDRPRGRRRRSRDEEDDDDEDRPRRGGGGPVASGWGAWKTNRDKQSEFPDEFKATDEAVLIKFTDDAPYATYRQHWIEGLRSTKKKSFICLEDDCPLCEELGDNPRVLAEFNVVLMDDTPKNMIWKVGTRVGGQLENLHAKSGPLTAHYWSVSKSGKGSATSYSIQKVKERDVLDDWGVEPLTPKEIKEFQKDAWDSSQIRYNNRAELRDIADEAAE